MEKQPTSRVAVTVWNGRISPVFDVARNLLLLDVADGRVTARREESLDGDDPGRQASRLTQFQPNALICGAISRPLVNLLSACGIRVLPFVAGETESVIHAYLEGTLSAPVWAMPGCCGHGGRYGRQGAGRGRRGCRYTPTGENA